ncbi:hypothetical protein V6N12_039249, partial [Hibiscus sabdariffa]
MGKPTGKKKLQETGKKVMDANKQNKGAASASADRTSKAFDEDTAIFINLSQELKEEGNRLFLKRDHEGAMLKYEKALNLLPKNHIDVAYLRTNMATCYMQLGLGEYPRAINECNLALEVSPKYSKALLRRARCYEALDRLDLAYRDVYNVLTIEPNNSSALEILDSVKKAMDDKGITVNENELGFFDNEPSGATRLRKVVKEKLKKKKNTGKNVDLNKKTVGNVTEEKAAEDKVVVEEKTSLAKVVKDKEVVVKSIEQEKKAVEEQKATTKTVKLVLGEDIRWAQIPVNCTINLVRDIIRDRFPGLQGVLVKYKDPEGDLVTMTSTDDLRLAESVGGVSGGSLRFYIVEVSPDQEPAYEVVGKEDVVNSEEKLNDVVENGEAIKGTCMGDWIVQFALLFKNHVGFDSDSYLDLHELGMKLYSEAMADAVTSEDAQELFEITADKFQEMAALALFNWGNVHKSRARKHVSLTEDGSTESILAQVKIAYEWAQKEYVLAAKRYEEALKIKPDFHEGLLALGQQQFEQAKLCWYHAIACKINLDSGPSEEVLMLFNKAEDSMENGMQIWEETEERRLNGLSKFDKYKAQLQKMGLDGLFKDVSPEEAAEQAANMSSQIYLLWGTLLYERSVVEYKIGLPTWEECLEVAVEKFELAGASTTDLAVMIKNHCSNQNASEGLGFKIDEIIQAWNEMYDVKRWQTGVPSFRLEPLFRHQCLCATKIGLFLCMDCFCLARCLLRQQRTKACELKRPIDSCSNLVMNLSESLHFWLHLHVRLLQVPAASHGFCIFTCTMQRVGVVQERLGCNVGGVVQFEAWLKYGYKSHEISQRWHTEQRCSYQHVDETFEPEQNWHQSPNNGVMDLNIEWSTWDSRTEPIRPVVGSSSSSNPWEEPIYNYPTVGETTYQHTQVSSSEPRNVFDQPPVQTNFGASSSSHAGHDDDVYRPQFDYPQPSTYGQSMGVDSVTCWLSTTTISTPSFAQDIYSTPPP